MERPMEATKKDGGPQTDVAALFNDAEQKAELETFLKEKAGVAETPEDKDLMDTAFF